MMGGHSTPMHIFRDPKAAAAASAWLSSSATPQEQSIVAAFFSTFGFKAAAPRTTSLPPRPGTQPRAKPATPQHTVQNNDAAAELAAVGSKAVLRERPATAPKPTSRPASPPRPSTAAGGEAASKDWVTTNEQFYGFQDLHPELYATAAAATKAVPAPNLMFKSEYSDSLKKGSGEYWKQFLQTTNQRVNRTVHKPNRDYQARKEAGFYYWLQKQRLYYGDFLTDAAAGKLDNEFSAASSDTKAELLAAARLLFAVVQPNKNKSTAHLHHCEQKSMTEPYYEALLKEVTKTKTMGAPKTLPPRNVEHRVAAAQGDSASLAGSERQLRRKVRGKHGAAHVDVETLASKIPIKWAVGTGATNSTTYADTIGTTAAASIKAAKHRAKAFEPVVITCPIGSCDPVTDISRLERFAVPEGHVQATVPLFTSKDRNPPETTARMAFQPGSAADAARSMAAAEAQVLEAQKLKNMSTIPLGRGGFNLPHDGRTEKSRNYHEHPINVKINAEASKRALLANNGPTSSVGVTLGGWQLL